MTVSKREQLRVQILVNLEGDRLTAVEAAETLGVSARQLGPVLTKVSPAAN